MANTPVTDQDIQAIRERVTHGQEGFTAMADVLTLLAYIDQQQAPDVGPDPTGGAEPVD